MQRNKVVWALSLGAVVISVLVLHQGQFSGEKQDFTRSKLPDSSTSKLKIGLESSSAEEETTPQLVTQNPPRKDVAELLVGQQINDAISHYDEISKYPPYSQPIISTEHLNAFVNQVKSSSSLPFPFTDMEQAINVSISLDEYNYFYGDTILAGIEFSNIPADASFSLGTRLMGLSGEILAENNAEAMAKQEGDDSFNNGSNNRSSHKSFLATFDTKDYDTSNWPLEMNLAVKAEVDGHPIFMSSPFRINKETAELQSLGYSEVKGEYLFIPVNLDVFLKGYYFVSGVLYGAESERPLVYLEAEGVLDEGSVNLELRAHVQALKQGGDEGPYELRDVRLERWSDEIIQMDVAGKVMRPAFSVEGYKFDEFEDKHYQDPLKEERIRIMQGLSAL